MSAGEEGDILKSLGLNKKRQRGHWIAWACLAMRRPGLWPEMQMKMLETVQTLHRASRSCQTLGPP